MKKLTKKQKRKLRTRKGIFGTNQKPRLSVFRSNKHIYAQLIDDEKQTTLVGMSTAAIETKGVKTEKSFELGKRLGKAAIEKKIKFVVFDRGSSKFHGRVRKIAEGARESGLKF